MNIIHLRETWCSGAPEQLSKTLDTIHTVNSKCLVLPVKRNFDQNEFDIHITQLVHDIIIEYKPDIIHWHQCFNFKIYNFTKKIKHIIHYHGAPEMQIAMETAHGNKLPPGVRPLVCAHYHPGCEVYHKCTPIRNITTLPRSSPGPLGKSKLENRVRFISSFTVI